MGLDQDKTIRRQSKMIELIELKAKEEEEEKFLKK